MRRWLQIALAAAALAACGALFGVALFYATVLRNLPEIYSLRDYRPNLITHLYAADGTQIGTFARERRIVVPIEEVPTHVVHAFIAAEDNAFYEHEGLDYPGILRAALANLRSGRVRQGGSTITQQVAKTFLLSSERSIVRKLKDMVLAMRIEEYLEKNEILYLYLNQIYLGSGAYGIEAAARTYFDKPVGELTLAEGALIAGLVPAPSRYTPFKRADLARTRQRFVLRQMLQKGFIDAEQHDTALDEPLAFVARRQSGHANAVAYFTEEIRRYLVNRYGEEAVLTGGLQVTTTLDVEAQVAAYQAVRRGLVAHDRRNGFRGPIRVAPEEEWLTLAEDLEVRFGEDGEEPGDVVEALVLETDNDTERIRLALGLQREAVLTLEDVKWAREPDLEWDGAVPRIRHVSQALRPGYLVRLERIGTRDPSEEELAADPEAPRVETWSLYQEPLAQGALLSMDIETGHVEAMIGGYSFQGSQFNRATQMRRQPGSAFKPVIYASAMSRGYTPATIVFDTPIVYEDDETGVVWKPGNYTDRFYGPITLREALAHSRNIATIKVLRDIGIPPVLELSESLGIGANLEPNLSLALGASEVTLGELVRAYGVFAAGGRRIDPVFMLEVRDREGVLMEHDVRLPLEGNPDVASADSDAADGDGDAHADRDPDGAERASSDEDDVIAAIRARVDRADDPDALPEGYGLDPVSAYLMTDLLKAVVQEGTGWRVRALKRPMAGKTGTTNDLHDAWFLGYSPRTVAGVWVGFDTARNLGKNETGSRTASPIFVDFMRQALAGEPREEFSIPDGVEFARIDKKTGLRAPPGAESAVFQPFRAGTAPLDYARENGANGTPSVPVRLD
ncbi:MAG: PBP1A family penicillin-binding protein [Deltaproteobacteria bacterium]|nr:PBP1A family penicillin-binding protein [Deltaproteobacteria bacterium]